MTYAPATTTRWRMVCTADSTHDRFRTTVTVLEEWKVDCFGNFVEVIETIDVIDPPSPYNEWTCECGAQAKHEDYEE